MFEALDDQLQDPELAAMLATDLQWRTELPEEPTPPPWSLDPDTPTVSDGERITALTEQPPSVLATEALAHTDPAALRHDELIDYLTLIEKQKSWLESLHHRALATLDTRDRSELKLSREEAMCALRVSSRAAQRMIATSRSLHEDLPHTLTALAHGTIGAAHARNIAAASWKLPPDVRPELEAHLLPDAAGQTPSELRSAIDKALIRIDPATATQRHHKAYEDRGVALTPLPDGMAHLTALLSAADAQAILTRLTAATKLLPAHDTRTLDQQRADLLIDALLGGLPHDALPELQGRRPSINIHVSLETLLGLDDHPGHLEGYGPITATEARRLAHQADSTWRRLVTDPLTGQLLDHGRATYRPPQALTDHVLARDGHCGFPGCHQPGYLCDLDHLNPWQQGGTTCPTNTAPLCRRHHRCKTTGPFRYHRNNDGSYTWNLDGQHTYTSRPPNTLTPPQQPEPSWAERLATTRHERQIEKRQTEDSNYRAAHTSISRDLTTARNTNDQHWQHQAQTALTELEDQRATQLDRRHRHDQLQTHRNHHKPTPTPPTNYNAPPPF